MKLIFPAFAVLCFATGTSICYAVNSDDVPNMTDFMSPINLPNTENNVGLSVESNIHRKNVLDETVVAVRSSSADALNWKLDPKTAGYLPLPFEVEGKCQQGKQYTVNSIGDLYTLIPEIECVWTQALVPNKVPLGACYGRLLTYANSAFIDPFIEFIYQGDYLVQTRCGENYYNIGILNFGGLDVSTGIWTISALPDHFTFLEGEQYDGRAGVLMDFTVNVEHYCPLEVDKSEWARLAGFRPFTTGTWPYRLFIDMLRVVGRGTDNCAILLGRTWMLDPSVETKPLYTVLYFTLKSCDAEVLPDFERGTALNPIPETFTYNRRGVFEFLSRINPVKFGIGELAQSNPNGIFDYLVYGNTHFVPPSASEGDSDSSDVVYAGEKVIKLDPVTRTIKELAQAIKINIEKYWGAWQA